MPITYLSFIINNKKQLKEPDWSQGDLR